jgi:hypothetical protein
MNNIKQFSDWQEIRQDSKLEESVNKHMLNLHFKKKAKEKAAKAVEELEKVQLSEEEIVDILKKVHSKKYDVLGNMDKMKKLQKMGYVKYPNAIQKASSFSFPFYLTAKGEKLIK